ncbi:Protein IMPACT [Heterocephalus glaber]|uniref:Protein IMPACT n=1 Tax=Heterocephalus glaber TaxID=10181 RepID=G5CB85_HETGA|nr:Protein IMPACT [Heterocephalus glaber]
MTTTQSGVEQLNRTQLQKASATSSLKTTEKDLSLDSEWDPILLYLNPLQLWESISQPWAGWYRFIPTLRIRTCEYIQSLEEIYMENIGESILYLWVEKIRDVLIRKSQLAELGPVVQKKTEEEDVVCEDYFFLEYDPGNPHKTFDYSYSENPPDRRSTFQTYLAPEVCPKQVKMILAKLYENKKIASATHTIYAYRIYCEGKQTFLQDCEDDGETVTAAGGRLLHLMEILNVRNVMVVVSGSYGGILLGPDHFKCTNNCARNILVKKNTQVHLRNHLKVWERTKK